MVISFENLDALVQLLNQDVCRCYGELEEAVSHEDYEFWARVTTRSVFAAISGMCEYLSAQAFTAESNKAFGGEISLGKLSVLAGETYFVNDNGEIRPKPIRIRFLDQVMFSLNSYAEAQCVTYRAKKDTAGWQSLKNAVATRNKITHPKDAAALEMTKADLAEVKAALHWFLNELTEILRAKGCDIQPPPIS